MAEAVHDAERLKELQALPLDRKIQITQTRIIEWYQHYNGQVCVSFSGGKDSTVLLHIARQLYPSIPAVFSNTGLEYPEIQRFVKSFDNVDIVTPSMNFGEVISTYGYPLIGKEVAEAIYYARRIRPSEGEIEIWRKRRELLGQRQSANKGSCWATERLEETGTGGGEEPPHRDEYSEKQKDNPARTVWREVDWKRLEIGGRIAGERRSTGRSRQTRTSTEAAEPG